MIKSFTTGNSKTKARLNEIVTVANKTSLVSQAVKRDIINRFPWLRASSTGTGTGIRRAYCKTSAASGSTIVCYLDENITVPPQDPLPTEITVTCDTFDTINLSECLPLLTIGTAIPVYQIGTSWYCCWPFLAWCEE